MTIKEFIEHNNIKPLSAKELAKGKSHLKIYGTQDPMPWDTIYTRLAAGQDMSEIAKMYGHKRQIALWAQQEGVQVQQPLVDLLEQEVTHRKTITAIADKSPDAANTLMEMVNEIAPDYTQNVAMFSSELVDVARTKLKSQFIEANDLLALAKAVQTVTDSTGHTIRHASAAAHTTNHIAVTGFSFLPDVAPADVTPQLVDAATVIDVPTIIEEEEEEEEEETE